MFCILAGFGNCFFFPGFTDDEVLREACDKMTIGIVSASGHLSHSSTSSSVTDLHSQLHPGEGDKSDTVVQYHMLSFTDIRGSHCI